MDKCVAPSPLVLKLKSLDTVLVSVRLIKDFFLGKHFFHFEVVEILHSSSLSHAER